MTVCTGLLEKTEMESPIVFTSKLFLIPIVWERGASVVCCVWVCVLVYLCVSVCQQDQDQVTQSDLTQPGLIKAALRPGGLETQHCFCCPTQGVFPLEGEYGGVGVLLIREKETISWLGRTLFHSLLVEIKLFLYFYECFLQPHGPFFSPMLLYHSPFSY